MKKFNKEVGNYGENIAKNYLISKNYELLELNYRNRYGEIDIICFDKDVIVFVEVKSRFDTSFGNPLEAINLKKQLEKTPILFKVKTGDHDRVFGSISAKQIKDELHKKGFKIDKIHQADWLTFPKKSTIIIIFFEFFDRKKDNTNGKEEY